MPHDVEKSSTTTGLPISPSMGPTLQAAHVPMQTSVVDGRVVFLCGLAIFIALAAAVVAQVLQRLIFLITNISFYGKFSLEAAAPCSHGFWTILIPVAGGIVVGFMARYGSKAIRGHGIPEAMEQVLLNESRIPPRMTFLKPLSAAIAIGTGGPFGAEGPIIATGGALGSLVGQLLHTTASERKTLLAAGAAAGMAATFGSPVSAVLLAVELLLFEFRPRSMIPVALAASCAAGMRLFLQHITHEPAGAVFPMANIDAVSGAALTLYILVGAVMGIASVVVTRAIYFIEDLFEHLPIHWMWWPAVGAVAVGAVGMFYPKTMGVGYSNITDILAGTSAMTRTLLLLGIFKFISWSISLGSGTSGGTLAPLFTIGGTLGAVMGIAAQAVFPEAHVNIGIAGLVGMATMFAGASRALLTSAVFAFETTLQPLSLLPLLGGCTASYLISTLLMRNSIMTEKIVRRGVRVPSEYAADFLDMILVSEMSSRTLVTLRADDTLATVRGWIDAGGPGTTHQGFPVLDAQSHLQGVVTRRDLLNAANPNDKLIRELLNRPPVVVYDNCTLRDAADHMVRHNVGRLPVISRQEPAKVVGMITRSDLLAAHRRRLHETHTPKRTLAFSK